MALWLRKCGIEFRIIDKNESPIKNSGALLLHARTLEFYRQLDIIDEVIAAGKPVSEIKFYYFKNSSTTIELYDPFKSRSPYPALYFLSQDTHERILTNKLKSLNINIERKVELKTFTQNKFQVESVVKSSKGEEIITSTYLCACDGDDSLIRRILGVKFFRRSFHRSFFLADSAATATDDKNKISVYLSRQNASIVQPLTGKNELRIMGIVPPDSENKENLSFVNIADEVTAGSQLHVDEISWFTVYKVIERIASHIRQGRTFLIGGAGHTHSPAFSHGMNAGIGDAINLAWKLNCVLKGQTSSKILLTFETERIAFAEKLNRYSDHLFHFISGRSFLGGLCRSFVIPLSVKMFRNFRFFRNIFSKFFSQSSVNYRESLLSDGSTGKIRAGDRLPWLKTDTFDNYTSLNGLEWHIQIYGRVHSNFNSVANFRGFRIYEFEWGVMAEEAGFAKDAFYLVRPDGHIALCDLQQNPSVLKQYLNEWDIDYSQKLKSELTAEKFQPENLI